MAERFLPTDALIDAVEETSFDQPPALIANAHITGLAVARALDAHDIPVITLDRTADGVAFRSDAVELAGAVTYPLDDPAGFREDVEAIARASGHEPVAFGCMDEWVLALAETQPTGVTLPFAADQIEGLLDKTQLYHRCERLDIPYPETYRLTETGPRGDGPPVLDAEAAAETLGFPLVLKPARKRDFEEALGTNVIEVANKDEYETTLERSIEADVRVMAQELVNVDQGADRSVVSYVDQSGESMAIVGSPWRYPTGFGTSCAVDIVDDPTLTSRSQDVLTDADYGGISEAEFVRDADREEYVLLDVNTRPWKWIGLPIAAGVDLPTTAYVDAIGNPRPTFERTSIDRWVYLADYLKRITSGAPDVLTTREYEALLSGSVHGEADIVTAVYDPEDPGPSLQLLDLEIGTSVYYCAC